MNLRPLIHKLAVCKPLIACRQLLALTLILSAGPTLPLFAQAAAVLQSTSSTPMALHITILDGEDALNSIRERTAREPIVQVEDENHKPVAGALVLFAIQNGGNGAGGTFAGSSTITVTTGADGRAVAHGLLPNKTTGQYTIAVSASVGTLVATAIVHQGNVVSGGTPPSTPNTPASPGASPTPAAPGTPVAPGTPGAPGTPTTPGAPTAPGTSSSTTTPGTTTAENPAPSSGSSSIGHKVSRFSRIPKKFYIAGGSVIVAGTVIGVVVATRGNSPTTITPGTGTVGP